ncbi:MAG: NAD(P)-binding oxidoreductase [Planctomycetota bacterium]
MTTLIVGGTGATGRLLVERLLDEGHHVKVIVRSAEGLPSPLSTGRSSSGASPGDDRLTVMEANLLEVPAEDLERFVSGCDAVVSCLGHRLTARGLFGPPYRLVKEATRRLCEAIQANGGDRPTKFLLMNTTGCRNHDLDEPISFAQHAVIGLLRLLLPPHADNEAAAHYLRTQIGQDHPTIEWVAVRPDALTDEAQVTDYELHPSPIRSAIFDAGKTSRINVAHFMVQLITNETLWTAWKGRMPVIYNKSSLV